MAEQVTAGQRGWFVAAGLVAIAATVAIVFVVAVNGTGGLGILGDLEIYRGAISSGLGGGALYDWVYQGSIVGGLGFTYPPFAALVLAWLVLLPLEAAKGVWIALSYAVVVACIFLLVRRAGIDGDSRLGPSPTLSLRVSWTAGLVIASLLTYPFVHNLVVGQVSLFVIALALFDHQLPVRWQGALVGLAGAIKLTPLVFVPYYLFTRQWRQAAVASVTFAAATGLAFLLMPQASFAYWGDKLWQTERVGRIDSTVNKSLLGVMTRLFGDDAAVHVGWVLVAVAVTGLALWQARRSFIEDDLVGATLVMGALSVAISPISWPHHQLWLILAACWWLLQRGRLPGALAAVLFAIFIAYPCFDDYAATSGVLAVGVELPALAVLLVLGFGSRPGVRRSG